MFAKGFLTLLLCFLTATVYWVAGLRNGAGLDREPEPDFFATTEGALLEDPQRWLRRAPLATTPLLAAALDASQKNDQPRFKAALDAAIKRDPRSEPAWMWRAENAAIAGKYQTAIEAIVHLIRINRRDAALYYELLADIAQAPEGAEIVLETFSSSNDIISRILPILIERQTNPDLLFAFSLVSDTAARRRFLQYLLRTGDQQRAFIAWLQYLPEDRLSNLTWPINTAFTEPNPYPPFDWSLNLDKVETSQDGLYTVYLGRGQMTFAEQIMPLTPGRYRFRAEMTGYIKPRGGRFAWTIHCVGEKEPIMYLSPKSLSATRGVFEIEFETPSTDCAFQYLALRSEPGEYARRATAQTYKIGLESIQNSKN
ncbi:MAG: hypothetical protein AAF720_15065 [Pseudomonadota bacterium]